MGLCVHLPYFCHQVSSVLFNNRKQLCLLGQSTSPMLHQAQMGAVLLQAHCDRRAWFYHHHLCRETTVTKVTLQHVQHQF